MNESKGVILTVNKRGEGLYKEKGSKFLAFAYKVESEQEVKEKLLELRKQYHDARHHCYAYIIGEKQDQYRVNDDGEPKNSAGMPIYGQIRSYNLTNVLVVVVRYFGGTKLGVSGLIRAYKLVSQDAINNAEVIEEVLKEDIRIKFQYEAMNKVMRLIKKYDIEIKTQTSELDCEMLLTLPLNNYDLLKEEFKEIDKLKILEKQ